jgi:hypothetical protein
MHTDKTRARRVFAYPRASVSIRGQYFLAFRSYPTLNQKLSFHVPPGATLCSS